MLPWSVMPVAGCPSRTAAATGRRAGRTVEHRVLGVLVQMDERIGHVGSPPRGAPVESQRWDSVSRDSAGGDAEGGPEGSDVAGPWPGPPGARAAGHACPRAAGAPPSAGRRGSPGCRGRRPSSHRRAGLGHAQLGLRGRRVVREVEGQRVELVAEVLGHRLLQLLDRAVVDADGADARRRRWRCCGPPRASASPWPRSG